VEATEQHIKFGFIDMKGVFILKPRFDNARPFHEDAAPVRMGHRWGFIDRSGKFIAPAEYDDATVFMDRLAGVKTAGKWGYIDKTGRLVIKPTYDRDPLLGDLSPQVHCFNGSRAAATAWGMMTLIDKTGRPVTGKWYDRVEPPKEGFAAVEVNDKWGFLTLEGSYLVEPAYAAVSNFASGLAAVQVDNKWGYVDAKGKLVIPCSFDDVKGFLGPLAPAKSKGKWGFIDQEGGWVITPTFDDAYPFRTGAAPVLVGERWGFVDTHGRLLVEPTYDSVEMAGAGFYTVESGNSCGYTDARGKLVVPVQFQQCDEFSEGLAAVRREDKWGFVDQTGKIVISPRYIEASSFSQGLAAVGIPSPTPQGLAYSKGEEAAFGRSDFATALKQWLPLATNGYSDAQSALCEVYMNGRIVAKDAEQAAAWCGRAASSGDMGSMLNLALLHFRGTGVELDYELALDYLRRALSLDEEEAKGFLGSDSLWKAADRGHPEAKFLLGAYEFEGLNGTRHFEAAMSYFRAALLRMSTQAEFEADKQRIFDSVQDKKAGEEGKPVSTERQKEKMKSFIEKREAEIVKKMRESAGQP
jgi:hypothetical protein